jgi:hypothetical protein
MWVTIFILSDAYRITVHFVSENVFLTRFTDKLTRSDLMLEFINILRDSFTYWVFKDRCGRSVLLFFESELNQGVLNLSGP